MLTPFPVLFKPTSITNPLLRGLKYFSNLRSLITSVWLPTTFEDQPRDHEIIRYWLDARSPRSTALVTTALEQEPEGWERELRAKYAPDALSWHVTRLVGPHLSEEAKARVRGIHVRASISIGEGGGIFDLDMHIGKDKKNNDICLDHRGPREELEPERRGSKLENRRWF